MNPQRRRTTGKQGGRGQLLSKGEEMHIFTIQEGREKEEELNFSEKTTSTCYPVGQFSIYRLDKVSAPATQTSVLTPICIFCGQLDTPIGE